MADDSVRIRQVAVIGAGVMGSGIAAHLANAGVPVLLLDIVPPKVEDDRSAIARDAIARLARSRPAPLMAPDNATLITAGNLEDDLDRLRDVDWVIEVVAEDLAIKQGLYARILPFLRSDAVVSSNTSTFPLKTLVARCDGDLARRFLITHFFNPPRYMRLLEVVTGAATDERSVRRVEAFCDERLGKSVVRCGDHPGFIANRIGTFFVEVAIEEALSSGLPIETVDAICGPPMGFPKTGVFGLLDLVGLDLFLNVGRSLRQALPPTDDLHRITCDAPLLEWLVSEGRLGRKAPAGGFYRQVEDGGVRTREVLDIATRRFRPQGSGLSQELQQAGRDPKALLALTGPCGTLAQRVLLRTLRYAASLVPDVSDRLDDVDLAMRLGYNWRWGPFELVDQLGSDWVMAALEREGLTVPALIAAAAGQPLYRHTVDAVETLTVGGRYRRVAGRPGVLRLADIKRGSRPLIENRSAALWDLGDGVLDFEICTKSNAIDQDVFVLLQEACDLIGDGQGPFRAMVIYSDAGNFAAGADLRQFATLVEAQQWGDLEAFARAGQAAIRRLKELPFPVVSAVAGAALGGGCELALHSTAVQAHAEVIIGLVEVGVGIVPAWGGCTEMLHRCAEREGAPGGPMPAVMQVFNTIGTATTATSAADARRKGFLRDTDHVSMNRDRLLTDAKALALSLVGAARPATPAFMHLPGPGGCQTLLGALDGLAAAGKATPHDMVVCRELARVLTGGETDPAVETPDAAVLELEVQAAMKLFRTEGTLARIRHLLETGRTLRN